MSGSQGIPARRMTVAPMEPGVRAARERVGLTQEQVAEQANMSIHTFRRWDRGRHRPGSPEQMQLLAMILQTSIEVLWPPRSNPQVARASATERARARDAVILPGEADVGQPSSNPTDSDPVAWPAAPGDERTTQESPASLGRKDVERIAPAEPRVAVLQSDDRKGRSDQPATPPGRPRGLAGDLGYDAWDETPDVAIPASAPPAEVGVRTLNGARPPTRLSWRRTVTALTVAGALGVGAMVAASAVGDRQAGAVRAAVVTEKLSPKQQAQQRAAAARSQSVAQMQAAGQRGDYDAAIVLARRLDDQVALAGYREAAAKVLVGRAWKAARRGDLLLARSRLDRAQERYETAPGAGEVRARIRRIEQQRAARVKQRHLEARRAATVAAQRASAHAAAVSGPSSTESPSAPAVTSQQSAPAPSAPARSSSSSSGGSGGGGGKDPEKAVDPGLF